MKIILLSLIISFAASSARAYIYESEYRHSGSTYLDRLSDTRTDDIYSLPSEQQEACNDRYQPILADSQLDIRVSLGYLDWTTGSRINYGGNDYGYSPSTDLGAWSAMRRLALQGCYGNLEFCGFRQDPNNEYVFRKNVRIRGQTVGVRMEIQFGSATESLSRNLGRNRAEQESRTSFMNSYFTRSLQSADAVFYFGHARSGGGPDFAPPVFVSGTNKVDYRGYYLPNRFGLKRMISGLSGSRKAPIVGVMACNSRDLFLKKLRAVAPDTGFISTLDVSTVAEPFTATLGAIDSLMRGQCQKSFYQSIRLTSRNQQYITMDGMFE
jgi:hypothetical protein